MFLNITFQNSFSYSNTHNTPELSSSKFLMKIARVFSEESHQLYFYQCKCQSNVWYNNQWWEVAKLTDSSTLRPYNFEAGLLFTSTILDFRGKHCTCTNIQLLVTLQINSLRKKHMNALMQIKLPNDTISS